MVAQGVLFKGFRTAVVVADDRTGAAPFDCSVLALKLHKGVEIFAGGMGEADEDIDAICHNAEYGCVECFDIACAVEFGLYGFGHGRFIMGCATQVHGIVEVVCHGVVDRAVEDEGAVVECEPPGPGIAAVIQVVARPSTFDANGVQFAQPAIQ